MGPNRHFLKHVGASGLQASISPIFTDATDTSCFVEWARNCISGNPSQGCQKWAEGQYCRAKQEHKLLRNKVIDQDVDRYIDVDQGYSGQHIRSRLAGLEKFIKHYTSAFYKPATPECAESDDSLPRPVDGRS